MSSYLECCLKNTIANALLSFFRGVGGGGGGHACELELGACVQYDLPTVSTYILQTLNS